MKLNSKCMACQIRKQEAKIRHFNDEDRKKQYMEAIRQRFEHPKDDDCVPSISTELKKFYCSFWGVPMEDFTRINKEYDQLMLDLEAELRSTIRYSEDPLKAALIYARTGRHATTILNHSTHFSLSQKRSTKFRITCAHLGFFAIAIWVLLGSFFM